MGMFLWLAVELRFYEGRNVAWWNRCLYLLVPGTEGIFSGV